MWCPLFAVHLSSSDSILFFSLLLEFGDAGEKHHRRNRFVDIQDLYD